VPTDVKKHGEIFANAFMKVLAYFSIGPFDHYTAYIEILKPLSDRHKYGFSMEHQTSSTYFLGVDRAIDANTSQQQFDRDLLNFAHHVTHSWIPKTVYGTGYMPFTWELAPQIDSIWFNEGFARYVAIEALSEKMPAAEARKFRQERLDGFAKLIDSMPQFIRSMSLVELSRVASTLYSDDFRTGQTLFSKGALMAAAMDDSIRKQTHGRKRLRDSLRALVSWGEHSGRAFRIAELPGLIARPVGVNEQSIRTIMNQWLKGN
jgi:predicted metalloprotease with PDZ domain